MLFGWVILDAIGKTLSRTWFSIWIFIDSIVYGLISTGYQVFLLLSKVSFYNSTDNKIAQITNRVYVILGVAMLFVLAYNIILLIVNPDNLNGKDSKSIKGLAKNFVISIVVLTLLPTIFNYMNKLQNDIVDSRVIEKVILGNDGSLESKNTHDLGKDIALMVFSSFYTPIDSEGNVVSYYQCKQDSSLSSSCSTYVKYYEAAQKYGITTFIGASELFEALFKTDGVLGYGAKVPTMQYLYFISTIVGVIVALMFTSYAIDIAVRVAKLAFLQIIAPIPVILRITKPSGGVFSKWLDNLVKTYLTLFLRLITIYFSVELIAIFADNLNLGGVVDNSLNYPVMVYLHGRILIIVGILLFAKEAPKLLSNLAGTALGEGSGFSFKDIKNKFAGAGATAASIPILGKGLKSTWGAVTGAAGAATSSLMNNLHGKSGVHMNTQNAMKQGAAQGWKNGGNQFSKQKQKVYQETYGYDRKQGIFGGKAITDKVSDKWGKAYSGDLKNDAAKENEAYLNKNLAGEMPKTEADIGTKTSDYATKNGEYASSAAFKKAKQLVNDEERRIGTTYSDEERNTKINELLSQMATTTTDANEKRAIDSYLKRDSINEMYNASILSGNQEAINKVENDAKEQARSVVKKEIESKGLDKVISDPGIKSTLESQARSNAAIKISNAGGDFSRLGLSEEAQKDITKLINSRVEDSINKSGGTANIQLSAESQNRLQLQMDQIRQNNPNLQSNDIANIEAKLRDELVKIQETNAVKNQVISDYMINLEYETQVENHLYEEKIDQVKKDVMEKAVQSATNEIAAQMKEYAEGLANGTYSNDVTGKLDGAYSERFVSNEKVINDGVKSKSDYDKFKDDFIKEMLKDQKNDKK